MSIQYSQNNLTQLKFKLNKFGRKDNWLREMMLKTYLGFKL